MASPTRITKFRRERKKSKSGRKRKAQLRSKGSTKSMTALFGSR